MITIPKYLLESEEPVFVCSGGVLRGQIKSLRKTGVEVFYSVKTNPERKILKELHGLDVGFSVSDPEEFLLAMSVGATPGEIMYYERGLSKKKAKWLVSLGCKVFAVESKSALKNLIGEASESSTVMIRVKAEKTDDKYSSDYRAGIEAKELPALLEECKTAGFVTGILHHSTSQVKDPKSWRKKFDFLATLPKVDLVNIGGGIPIDYSSEKHDAVLMEIEKGVKRINADKVVAEPGRFIVGPACSLVTHVTLVDGRDVVVNCSVYHSHADTIIADIKLPCRTLREGENTREYRILGSTLCPLDIFCRAAKLPAISERDIIIFDDIGAYNNSSAFSSGRRIETYMVD